MAVISLLYTNVESYSPPEHIPSATMSGLLNKVKSALSGDKHDEHDTTGTSSHHGHHSGHGHQGPHSQVDTTSAATGPHSSAAANKLDPR